MVATAVLLAAAIAVGSASAEPAATTERAAAAERAERGAPAASSAPSAPDRAALEALEGVDPEALAALVAANEASAEGAAAFLREGTLAQYRIATLRFALNVAALVLFAAVACTRSRRGEPTGTLRLPRWGRLALVLLAVLQVGTNLNFVVRASPHGFHASDMFHYAFGSKYFPEVGYFDLYLCSAAATTEAGQRGAVTVRDLQSDRLERLRLRDLPRDRCAGRFSEARWAEFTRDVRWLRERIGDAYWSQTLRDHGFNPSPLWTAIGRPIASLVPIDDLGLRIAARLDWLLLAAAIGAAGRAFGLEAACLLALLWGGSGLNRYGWVGDSFLRQLWFAAAMVGLCGLRRRRWRGAGALLGAAAGMRLFPAVFLGGALLAQLRATFAAPDDPLRRAALVRTAAGALAALVILAGLGTIAAGRGAAVYGEFATNIRAFASKAAYNNVGLAPLVSYRESRPSAVIRDGERILTTDQRYPQALLDETRESRWPLEWGVALLFALLFARAVLCRGVRDWEVAAAGLALVPVLSQPPCYYVGVYGPVALLAARRPALRWAALGALVAWSGSQLVYYNVREEYVVGSAVALLLCLAVLLALQRDPVGEPRESERAT